MIYLASPYSHPNPAVMTARYLAACRATSEMMRRGKKVFSPIAHSHVIAKIGKLDRGWDFWQGVDCEWIRLCGFVCVLTLTAWEISIGVRAEISYAESLQIPITRVSPTELGIEDVPLALPIAVK